MAVSEEAVFEKLKNVIDPELFVNVVDLGLIYGIKLKPAAISSDAAGLPSSAPGGAAGSPQLSAATVATPIGAPGGTVGSPQPSAAAAGSGSSDIAATTNVDAPATSTDDKSDVFIEMTMTSPACPAGPQLIAQSKTTVGALEGVGNVEVKLVMTPPWTPERMTEDARDQLGIF